MDAAGEQHLHIEHNIYKRRLSLDGIPIEEPKKEDILKPSLNQNEVALVNSTEKPCGSCYGAEKNASHCCNTCEDVKEAYRARSWELKIETVEQCQSERYQEKLKSTFTEGCQIYGKLEVNRVEGSFHIAPGQSFPISEIHLHDVRPFLSTSFNTSHTIRHLSFGPKIENANTNLLDGHQVTAEEGATMFQYYIKIVPIAFAYQNHSIIYSNQYSVTTHKKTSMPGIFFSYDITSFMIKFTMNTRSLGHLLTTICAIVGGVYTVAAIIVSFIYSTRKALEKIELGKAS